MPEIDEGSLLDTIPLSPEEVAKMYRSTGHPVRARSSWVSAMEAQPHPTVLEESLLAIHDVEWNAQWRDRTKEISPLAQGQDAMDRKDLALDPRTKG